MSEQDGTGGGAPGVWVLTDGKIGDDVQCLAVAAALGRGFEKRVIAPRAPWSWLAPFGPVDPRDRPAKSPQSPISPPFPKILIASGRRSVPYARAVKRVSGGETRLVFMKDPRFYRSAFDVIWSPVHDRVGAANVFATLTSPHQMSAAIAAARTREGGPLADLPEPMLGVSLGGPGGGARYTRQAINEFAAKLKRASGDFASVAVAPSRRSSAELIATVRAALADRAHIVWNGQGENPYAEMLARSAAIIVTAESHNMMSEALAAGAGVYAWRPPSLAPKLAWFLSALESQGVVRAFDGRAVPFSITPMDATGEIVSEIQSRLGLEEQSHV